jgi:acetyltransferase-like isoleucine patch superfamily enzyme
MKISILGDSRKKGMSQMRSFIKNLVFGIAYMVVLPTGLVVNFEKWIKNHSEFFFSLFAQFWALAPGLPGSYLRAAFYSQVLDDCHRECYLGFGMFCTHRDVRIEKNVYIGPYSMIGSAWVKESSLIGSRVSLLSGKNQHTLGEDGSWSPFNPERKLQIVVGPKAWLGEGVILMADVGETSLIGSGAVVSSSVPAGVVGGGNPFRIIRRV